MFLHLESADWPGHFGGLAVLEGQALLDGSGRLRLPEIQERVNRRLAHVPQLRRRLQVPSRLGGRALWVDDDRFDIQHHIHETAVQSPGGDLQLLDAAARLYAELLDRRRPLWELWFLTGVSDGRIGALLKLHHAVADGMGAVAIMGSLFDVEPDAPDPVPEQWATEPIPGEWPLVADNVSRKIRSVARTAAALEDPLRLVRAARVRVRVAGEALGHISAPRTSLNQFVRSGRRIRFLRLDLEAMKEAAHAHEAKVNDVVLDLWSGGLRQLLLQRGEPTSAVELIANIPVSLRPSNEALTVDNQLGIMALPLPIWETGVKDRLDLIARTTRKAKSEQQPAATAAFLALASATPIGKIYSAHQHAVNVKVTNVIGPIVPMYALGARILDILPITRLFGNVGLTLCAFSYANQIYLVVTADAATFADLDVLMTGMQREWHELIGAPRGEPTRGGRVVAGASVAGALPTELRRQADEGKRDPARAFA